MGTKKWSEIKNRAPVPEELRKAAEAEMRAEIREYNLTELRRLVSELTQDDLAETLGINQSAVSKLERADDMSVSRLAQTIAALGGEMHISATFDNVTVPIKLGKATTVETHAKAS